MHIGQNILHPMILLLKSIYLELKVGNQYFEDNLVFDSGICQMKAGQIFIKKTSGRVQVFKLDPSKKFQLGKKIRFRHVDPTVPIAILK